jgi:hypothetical protein
MVNDAILVYLVAIAGEKTLDRLHSAISPCQRAKAFHRS